MKRDWRINAWFQSAIIFSILIDCFAIEGEMLRKQPHREQSHVQMVTDRTGAKIESVNIIKMAMNGLAWPTTRGARERVCYAFETAPLMYLYMHRIWSFENIEHSRSRHTFFYIQLLARSKQTGLRYALESGHLKSRLFQVATIKLRRQMSLPDVKWIKCCMFRLKL